MSSAPALTPSDRIQFDAGARARAAVLTVLFIALFWNVFNDLTYTWRHSEDWSHGWIIPFFSAYMIYLNWDRIKRCPVEHAWVGLPIMLFALAAHHVFLWYLPKNYLQQATMLVFLLGMVILLCGLPVMRFAWLPWLYLFFAVPLPKAAYFALTDPLKRLAAIVAVAVLHLFPWLDDVDRSGSVINYVYQGIPGQIGVADACSGMRSTITLCALGVAVTFMSARPWWQRVIMIASCVPIAVFSNFVRVTITCVLHIFVNKKYAEGNYHTGLGLLTLLMAFGMFLGVSWLLNNLMVDDDDAGEGSRPGKPREVTT